MKTYRIDLPIHKNFLTVISLSYFVVVKRCLPLWIHGWWEKIEKEDFYLYLNMEDIADADYAHTKRVCEDFEMKYLDKYPDLYVPGDTLLLTDIFKNHGRC